MYLHSGMPRGPKAVAARRLTEVLLWRDLRGKQATLTQRRFTFQRGNTQAGIPSLRRSQRTMADASCAWASLPNGI